MPHSRYRTMSGGRCQRRKRRSPCRSSSTCNYTLPSDRKTWAIGPIGTFSTTASRCPNGSVIAGDGEDGKRWCCALTQSVRRKYADTLVSSGMTPTEAVAKAVAAVPNRIAAASGVPGAAASGVPSAPPLGGVFGAAGAAPLPSGGVSGAAGAPRTRGANAARARS